MLVVSAALLLAAAVSVATAGLPAAAAARLDYASILLASAATATVGVGATVLLLPHVGVAGLALAQLLGVLVGRLTLFLSQRGSDPAAAARPSRSALPAVVRSSGALYLSSLAAQALTVCDLWTVGLLRGGAASASYRAGSLVPSQTASLFYRAYDVVYPRLPGLALAERQLRAVRLVTRISSGLAGVLFTFLLVERRFFVHLLVGSDDVLAQRVLAVFCLIWMVNVPIHGVSLLLIARDRPNVLAPLALGEAALNAVVSVVLVLAWGPLGAAWGTLLTMGVSNLVVMPMVAERRVPGCARVVLSGTASVLAGVVALLVLSWPASFAGDGAARLVADAVAALVAAVAVSVALGGRQDLWPRSRNA
jgi:O-antigen/teichoic acid export membrane protein